MSVTVVLFITSTYQLSLCSEAIIGGVISSAVLIIIITSAVLMYKRRQLPQAEPATQHNSSVPEPVSELDEATYEEISPDEVRVQVVGSDQVIYERMNDRVSTHEYQSLPAPVYCNLPGGDNNHYSN